jgi:hypothetical protein
VWRLELVEGRSRWILEKRERIEFVPGRLGKEIPK